METANSGYQDIVIFTRVQKLDFDDGVQQKDGEEYAHDNKAFFAQLTAHVRVLIQIKPYTKY